MDFKATLRVLTSDRDSTRLDSAFGVSCTRFDEAFLLDSNMKRLPCDDSYWLLEFVGKDAYMDDDVIRDILNLIEKRKSEIDALSEGVIRMDVSCMVDISDEGNGNLFLNCDSMRRMACLNIDIMFDIYG